jgi:hypothetical protein
LRGNIIAWLGILVLGRLAAAWIYSSIFLAIVLDGSSRGNCSGAVVVALRRRNEYEMKKTSIDLFMVNLTVMIGF